MIIAQPSRPEDGLLSLPELRRNITEVRHSWSDAERRRRLKRGQMKRAELLAILQQAARSYAQSQ